MLFTVREWQKNITKYYLDKITKFYNISSEDIIVYKLNGTAFEKNIKKGRNIYLIGNLKRLREFFELSQQEISDKLEINRSTYSDYENGRVEPSIEMLTRIIQMYNIITIIIWI